jgi:hypothetical protein
MSDVTTLLLMGAFAGGALWLTWTMFDDRDL